MTGDPFWPLLVRFLATLTVAAFYSLLGVALLAGWAAR